MRKIEIGGAPIGLLAYGGQLWVADARSNQVTRVEPQTGRVTARVAVGQTPLRIAALGGSLWSTDFDSGTVSQVSPSALRRVATIRVGHSPKASRPSARSCGSSRNAVAIWPGSYRARGVRRIVCASVISRGR